MTAQYPWQQFDCYEPAPAEYTRTRAPMTLRVFGWLCFLAAIGVALWAVNHG